MTTPSLILHVPHASRLIPAEDRATMLPTDARLAQELLAMTDAWTDDLVAGLGLPATRILFPVSRLVVDVERFPDDADEPMASRGMGALYTRLSTGEPLRHLDPIERTRLMDRYYWPHHRRLEEAVDAALSEHGRVLIVDIHSFSSVPLRHEPDQDADRPKLCLGFDAAHSPFKDDNEPVRIARRAGFATKVALNRPFSGSIAPAKHWRTPEVRSVMIEVRRDLYMNEATGVPRADFDKVAARTARLVEGLYRFFTRSCPTLEERKKQETYKVMSSITRLQMEQWDMYKARQESLGYTFDKFGVMRKKVPDDQ